MSNHGPRTYGSLFLYACSGNPCIACSISRPWGRLASPALPHTRGAPMATLTGETLAEILQEPKVPLLRKVLQTLGQDRCAAILADTLMCETNGGMLTKDGTRRRTPGGVFFQLVKKQATRQERHRLFYTPTPRHQQTPTPAQPHAHPQAPTWEEVHALGSTLSQGEATVKLTLIGRP